MKKQALKVLSILIFWSAQAVASANAQIPNTLNASIPYDLTDGNSALLAGVYAVKPASKLDEFWIPRCCTVFARNEAGQLILYGGLNQAENLSMRFPQGFEIAGLPRPVATLQAAPGLGAHWAADVFGRSASGELIHYSWNPRDDWRVENLTSGPTAARPISPLTSNPTFVGDPEVVTYYNGQAYAQRQDVFARNGSGQLIHYFRTPTPTGVWHAENLTVGSTAARPISPLTSNPIFVGAPDVVVSEQNGYLRHDVFASNSSGQLIHYWWSAEPPSGWHAENLTLVTSGPILASALDVYVTNSPFMHDKTYKHEVFARSDTFFSGPGHLIRYHWSAVPPAVWNFESLTSTNSGLAIVGDPVVMKLQVSHPDMMWDQ